MTATGRVSLTYLGNECLPYCAYPLCGLLRLWSRQLLIYSISDLSFSWAPSSDWSRRCPFCLFGWEFPILRSFFDPSSGLLYPYSIPSHKIPAFLFLPLDLSYPLSQRPVEVSFLAIILFLLFTSQKWMNVRDRFITSCIRSFRCQQEGLYIGSDAACVIRSVGEWERRRLLSGLQKERIRGLKGAAKGQKSLTDNQGLNRSFFSVLANGTIPPYSLSFSV